MRLRAGVGILLPLIAGCAQLPDKVLVQVGDRSIELKKKAAEAEAPGGVPR